MKANELRIGNLVFEEKGYPAMARIVGIKENNIIEIYSFMANNGADFNYECECSSCEPIPLTEEWLVKFGFVRLGNQETWFGRALWTKGTFAVMHGYGTTNGQRTRYDMIEFDYVHQLQNLYFALTGEELEIKNP